MSELKELIDSQNVSLYETFKELGMLNVYQANKRIYYNNDSTFGDMNVNVLLALSNYFNISLQDILNKNYLNGRNSEITAIKDNIESLKTRINNLEKRGNSANFTWNLDKNSAQLIFNEEKLLRNQSALIFENERQAQDYLSALLKSVRKLRSTKNIAARAGVHDVTERDTQHVAQNIPTREDTKTSPRAHETHNSADSENIAMRDTSVTGSENIAMRIREAATAENIPMRAGITPSDDIVENIAKRLASEPLENITLASVEKALKEYRPITYRNRVEAEKIFANLDRMVQDYENGEPMKKRAMSFAKHHLTPYTYKYLDNSTVVISTFNQKQDSSETGMIRCSSSIFNNDGQFLFTEIYSAIYFVEDDEVAIKYYKKRSDEIIQKDEEIEFNEEDEISRADYYYGLYKILKFCGLKV